MSGCSSSTALPAAVAVSANPSDPLASRAFAEPPHPYRPPFARDTARILHARAFRRLAGKTQVFTRLPGELQSDHFRSRLTHTLEVAQIARTLSGALGLNADLAEALALSHDIGHPPFGHAGEKALDLALHAHGLRFDHNLHALRIVTWFEERYQAFRGLNLTLAVREGIIKHSHDYSGQEHPELAEYFLTSFPPLEAQLIDLADEVAYLSADLDDGLGSGILELEDVRASLPFFRQLHDAALAEHPNTAPRLAVDEAIRRLLNLLATSLLEETRRRVQELRIVDLHGIRAASARLAALSPEMEEMRAQTKRFLYARLYNSPGMEDDHAFAAEIVTQLFATLMADPKLLPADHQTQIPTEGLARTVADYIAGMTDSFIHELWTRCCVE
jgi:dGTPase